MTGSAKDLMLVIMPAETSDWHRNHQTSSDENDAAVSLRKGYSPRIVLDADGVWLYRRNKVGKFQATRWDKKLNLQGYAEDKADDDEQ